MKAFALRIFAFTIGSVLVAPPVWADTPPKQLTGDQLRSEFVGKTYKVDWTDGKAHDTGTETIAADGTESVTMGGGYNDTGEWTIKGNLLCGKWKQQQGPGGCGPIYSLGDGKYLSEGKGKNKGQRTVLSQ